MHTNSCLLQYVLTASLILLIIRGCPCPCPPSSHCLFCACCHGSCISFEFQKGCVYSRQLRRSQKLLSILNMSEPLGRTRTAYDFERYATHGLRRYLKMFEIPRPPESNHREILLTLPRPEELFKSHENRNWTIVNEPWSKLEFINPIILSRNLVSMCEHP